MKRKKTGTKIWFDSDWVVVPGELISAGRPRKTKSLFQFVGEKLPYDCLKKVKAHVARKVSVDRPLGVYLAHDSFGVARYGGRGDIFGRLAQHKKVHSKELLYFSFFIIESKHHRREMETAILRAASSLMTLNERKVRVGLETGNVTDYEPGTHFVERQNPRGKPRKKTQKR